MNIKQNGIKKYISGTRLSNEIQIRINVLRCIIDMVKKQLKEMPSGRIKIGNSRGYKRFYLCDKEKRICKKYLSKSDPLVGKLAQKSYLEKVLENAEAEIEKLQLCLNEKGLCPEDSASIMPEALKPFIDPVCQNDTEFAEGWARKQFYTLDKYDDNKKYKTENGEFVRSKSEWIVANLLYKNGIPYKYEKKLVLPDGDFLFPDFTVLNLQTRQEVYIELFGMMGEAKYCSDAIKKINKYAANGIVVGDRLLPIFESQEVPLEIRAVRMTIDRLAMREAA